MMKSAVKVSKILSPFLVKANKIPTRRIAPYTTLVGYSSPCNDTSTSTSTSINFNEIQRKKNDKSSVATTEFQMISSSSSSSFGNPCLDLYFKVVPPDNNDDDEIEEETRTYLKQLLPLAWSYNPHTTLKLICNLVDIKGKYSPKCVGEDDIFFFTALVWLHHNHPKTLACNVEAITGDNYTMGDLFDYVEILYRLLLPKEGQDNILAIDYEALTIDNKAVLERYKRDPNYQFLHDRVSDIFADYLRSDIAKLKKMKPNQQLYEDDFSFATFYCPLDGARLSSHYDPRTIAASTLLCESIARKVFPRDEDEDEDEDDYTQRVLNQLKEFLKSVGKMTYKGVRRMSKTKQYFEDVKAGKSKIVAGAILPHKILKYVDDPDFGDVAELQWKAMVEDLSNKGKWKNCLAVCDVSECLRNYVSEALGLLLSQLSDQEPWKGKVIPFARNPDKLHLNHVNQGNDLSSKYAFMRGLDCRSNRNHNHNHNHNAITALGFLSKVLDLILQEAVNAHLKPEHMIKKLVVFANYPDLSSAPHWPTTYLAIRNKFEEKGYGDAVPHILLWDLWGREVWNGVLPSRLSGMDILNGFSSNFLKLFLDKEGEVGLDDAMEAAICGKPYQNLVVH